MILGFENWQFILFAFILVMFFIFGGGMLIFVLGRMRWPFKVTILEKTPPYGYIPTKNDRARLVKFGDGGEEIYFLKKLKKYKIGYGKKIGNKKIAWAIGEDGYWYNCTFGDMDKRLEEVGLVPVERDMRFANSTIRKGIENRYNDKNFFEKWGVPLTIGMLVIAIIVQGAAMWFFMSKTLEVTQAQGETTKASKEVIDAANSVLTKVATIKEGGLGYKPA